MGDSPLPRGPGRAPIEGSSRAAPTRSALDYAQPCVRGGRLVLVQIPSALARDKNIARWVRERVDGRPVTALHLRSRTDCPVRLSGRRLPRQIPSGPRRAIRCRGSTRRRSRVHRVGARYLSTPKERCTLVGWCGERIQIDVGTRKGARISRVFAGRRGGRGKCLPPSTPPLGARGERGRLAGTRALARMGRDSRNEWEPRPTPDASVQELWNKPGQAADAGLRVIRC